MICPNCGNRNRVGARFCDNCGTQLDLKCPNCGNINRPGAKFCDNCGIKLTGDGSQPITAGDQAEEFRLEPDSTPKLTTSLERIIPQEFASKLESALEKRSMVGERRVVTILFCDIVDSTVAAAQLDPEEWTEVINPAFEYIIRPVYKYEGMVARMMGDGILAFFGAPIAHEDDPLRAIMAGLEIIDGISRYGELIQQRWGIDLNVRVGVNTGMVVVGNVGTDFQMEYTAMGDAINVASRMETTALPGTVQVTADTQRIVSTWFEFEDLGEMEIKGKDHPVHAYRVLRGRVEPLDHRIELESPMVGRENEFEKIKFCLNDLQKGTGGIIGLLGDIGLGKSRLIREARNSTINNGINIQWYESTSLPYEYRQPYSLFQHLLRHVWGLEPQERGDRLSEQITKLVADFPEEDNEDVRSVIETFFGIVAEQERQLTVGEAYQHRLFQVFLDYIAKRTDHSLVTLVFDDLHWADPSSTTLIQHIIQLTDRSPLLILFAMHPDKESPGWMVKQFAESKYPHRYTEILLQPLTAEQGLSLVENLVPSSGMPDDVCQHILQKSEGNPLFLEEITHTLFESGAVTRPHENDPNSPYVWQPEFGLESLNIPDNLYTLLAARIDRLSESARSVLQLAAVIGRTFSYRILESFSESSEMLDTSLAELLRKELIYKEARSPELEYSFRHVLTRETAYRSILRQKRREYHLRVGEVLEELFAGEEESRAPTLAHHYEMAGDERKAFSYHLLAGEAAMRVYAIPQALERFEKALNILRRYECEPDLAVPDKLSYLYGRMGRALELDGQFDSALAIYEELEKLSHQCDFRQQLLEALLSQALLRCTATAMFNQESGEGLLKQSMTLARELGDKPSEAKILWLELNLRRLVSDYRGAIEAGEHSLEIIRQLDLKDQLPYTLHDMGYAYTGVGMNTKAMDAFREARVLWQANRNLPLFADNLSGTIFIHYVEGEFDAAIAASEEAYRISNDIHNLWGQAFSRIEVGLVYRDRGEYSRALEIMQESIMLGDKGNVTIPRNYVSPQIGMVYGDLGLCSQGIEISEGSFAQVEAPLIDLRQLANTAIVHNFLQCSDLSSAKKIAELWELPEDIQAYLGYSVLSSATYLRFLLESGDLKGAKSLAQELTILFRRSGYLGFLAEILYYKALVYLALEDEDAARQVLSDALEIAESLEHRRILWQILATLSNITPSKEAARLRSQAKNVLTYIVDNVPEGEPRQVFLGQHRVRSFLEDSGLV